MAYMALLVVSCKKNECDKTGNLSLENQGMINEHLSLLKGNGITDLVVAINKMDSVRWSQARFETTKTAFQQLLEAQGFPSGKIEFVPVSSSVGENINKKCKADWYDGLTLLDTLSSISIKKLDLIQSAVINDLQI